MAVQGGFGCLLKVNTGSLTTIVGVMDVDFPVQSRIISESTSHSATSGYYTGVPSGKRRLEPFKATISWDDTAATNAALLTNFNASATVGFSIQDPGGQEIIAFDGYVENIGRVSKQDGTYQADVQIHPTGAPTIT